MKNSRPLYSMVAITAAAVAIGLSAPAQASVIVNATVGGAPTGVSYVNFDNLALGFAGGSAVGNSGSAVVSFGGGSNGGQTVTGTTSNYAAPFISNSNGVPFADSQVSGADNTRFLTTGTGTVKVTLPGLEMYVGMLWGSVDLYNTLQLFNGSTLVGTITGSDVTAAANGNQGVNGTYYVNIDSTLAFNNIVASSTQNAFEFDNVAYNQTAPVPEPFSLGLFGLGLVGLGVRRRKAASSLAV